MQTSCLASPTPHPFSRSFSLLCVVVCGWCGFWVGGFWLGGGLVLHSTVCDRKSSSALRIVWFCVSETYMCSLLCMVCVCIRNVHVHLIHVCACVRMWEWQSNSEVLNTWSRYSNVFSWLCVYVCMYVCVHVFVCLCVCVCVCVCLSKIINGWLAQPLSCHSYWLDGNINTPITQSISWCVQLPSGPICVEQTLTPN